MQDKFQLHEQVRQLWTPSQSWTRRAVVHALIELKYITEISCQMPVCIYKDRSVFIPQTGQGLSIDHINGRVSDEPCNLRLAHVLCNATAGNRGHKLSVERNNVFQTASRKRHLGAKRSIETKIKISKKAKGRKGPSHDLETCQKIWITRRERHGVTGRKPNALR